MNIEVVDRDNANRQDYDKTLVIVKNDSYSGQAKQIAEAVHLRGGLRLSRVNVLDSDCFTGIE